MSHAQSVMGLLTVCTPAEVQVSLQRQSHTHAVGVSLQIIQDTVQ